MTVFSPNVRTATFDLDGFKRLNDRLGHRAGDHVLADFAGCSVRSCAAPMSRCGWGDEFLVLLPGMGLEQVIVVAEPR